MPVVVQTPYNTHTANGVTTLFGFTFQLLDEGDLRVLLDGVPQVSGFTISGIGVQAGGSVTFSVAPANGVIVQLLRQIPLARSTDYQQNGDLPSATLDDDFDRLWQALQDQRAEIGGIVRAPFPEQVNDLPPADLRANTLLGFDADGQPVAIDIGDPSSPVTQATNVIYQPPVGPTTNVAAALDEALQLAGGAVQNPMAVEGDLIVGDEDGEPARLAPGGDDEVLTMVGGVPAWAPPAGASSPVVEIVSVNDRDVTPDDTRKYLRFEASGDKTANFDSADNFVGGEEVTIANRSTTGALALVGSGITLNPFRGGTLTLAPGDTVHLKAINAAVIDLMYGSTTPAPVSFPDIADNNATFTDEGVGTSGWTASNCTMSVSGSYLRATKSVGPGTNCSITKAWTFTPTNRDFIVYGKMRASAINTNDISVLWILNGAKEASIWLGTQDGGATGPASVIGSASIVGTTGASTYNRAQVAASGLSYDTVPVEFALHFCSKFSQITCWFREADGRWKFKARVACDFFSSTSVQILKSSGAPNGSWVEFDYVTLCKPNIVAIGDSICAGATLFNPNRTSGLTDDESSWMRHCLLYPSLRNNLIVNKGVGSQTSTQIQSRIAEATGEGPRVVILHASSNDELGGISKGTRTTNIQASITSITAANQAVVLLNAMYGTSGGADNTPTPDLRDYMTDWWENYLPTLTGRYTAIDIMQAVMGTSGFQDAALTQSDGIHPTPTGYELIGELIAAEGP